MFNCGKKPNKVKGFKPLLFCLGWLYLVLSGWVFAATQSYADFTRFSANHGVTDAIFSLAQDKQGFIWLGTSSGLVKYDGYQFQRFSNGTASHHQLQFPAAGTLFIDSQSRFWIGSWGDGLAYYDQNLNVLASFIQDPADPGSIPTNFIQTIFEDSQGTIWLGSNGGGLSRFEPHTETFTSYQHDPDDPASISHNRIWSIAQTEPNYLWVATNNGLNRFNQTSGKFERIYRTSTEQDVLQTTLVRALAVDKKGRLWVGTENGLGVFNTTSNTLQPVHPDGIVLDESITTIHTDLQDHLLIGTQRGLYKYDVDTDSFLKLSEDKGYKLLVNDDIRDMLIDPSGLLWLGTRYSGLIKVDTSPTFEQSIVEYVHTNGNKDVLANVTDIFKDSNNTLWVGALDGLYFRTSNTAQLVPFDSGSPMAEQTFNSIAERTNGEIWVTGDKGLFQADFTNNQLINKNSLLKELRIKAVTTMLADVDGSLWLGTWHSGLVHIEEPNVTYYSADTGDNNGLKSASVSALMQDSFERIWVGTDGGGLSRLDPGSETFVTYISDGSDSSTLSNNMVSDIFEDSQGVIWVGTNNKLNSYNNNTNTFKHYDEADGLSNSNIRSIIEDDAGNLWVGTSSGLFERQKGKSWFRKVSSSTKRLTNLFNGSAFKDEQGQLYFGGQLGVSKISPQRVSSNTQVPELNITDLWIDNQRWPLSPSHNAQTVQLSHEVSNIKVRFVAMNFRSPQANQFSYRLLGFETQWSPPSNQNFASYTNINPGEYTLEIKGSNNSNLWNPKPITLTLVIHPPWWDRLWIKLLSVALLLAAIYLWYRHRINLIARQKTSLEETVKLRTEELNQQQQQLVEAYQALERNSLTDELTQLHNRKFLTQHIDGEIAHVLRVTRDWQESEQAAYPNNADLIFYLIDLDDFKLVNDEHGHDAGDQVLRQIKPILQSVFRSSDFLIRWGGEEFLVIARNANRDDAAFLAERLRLSIEKHSFVLANGQQLTKTASIGFACYPFFRQQPALIDWYDCLKIADLALYAAKNSGRNGWVGLFGNHAQTVPDGAYLKANLPKLVDSGDVTLMSDNQRPLQWH